LKALCFPCALILNGLKALKPVLEEEGTTARPKKNVLEIIKKVFSIIKIDRLIIITGSLYLSLLSL